MGFNSFKGHFRRHFLAGILSLLPLIITIGLVVWLVSFIHSNIIMNIDKSLFGHKADETQRFLYWVILYISVFGLFIGIVTFVGFFIEKSIGKRLFSLWENFLQKRIPIVSKIYDPISKIFKALFSAQGQQFKRVALVEYPRKGVYSFGFVTSELKGIGNLTDEKLVTVFIPSTPNPTTGWLAVLPENEVISVDLSVEDAVKLILSGGIVMKESEMQEKFEKHGTKDS